jgi:hypothetical protein
MTNPIAAAVAPLKDRAIAGATEAAKKQIERIHAKLAEHGWDVDKAAPRGRSMKDSKAVYRQKNAEHQLFWAVTELVPRTTYAVNPPSIMRPSAEREAKFIAEAQADAAAQYEAFVAKLTAKVTESLGSEPVAAELFSMGGVWGYSTVRVTAADGRVENWKTQQIINVSVLGKLFNQWPTRKVK